MLTNTSMDQDSPLACLLVGQPTLRRTMKLAVLAALEQRITLRYAMPGMTAAETASYIKHHLNLAGRLNRIFTEDATNLIYTTSAAATGSQQLALPSGLPSPAAGLLVDETAARARPSARSSANDTGTLPTTTGTSPTTTPRRTHWRGVVISGHRHPQRPNHGIFSAPGNRPRAALPLS